MPRKIRVTETRVVEYTPNFAEFCYEQEGVTNVEAALELDKRDFAAGHVTLDELGKEIQITRIWEVINE